MSSDENLPLSNPTSPLMDPKAAQWANVWSLFAEKAADLVALVSQPSYSLSYLNPAGRRMLGLADGEVISDRPLMEFVSNASLWTLLNEAAPTALRSGNWVGDLEFRHVSGEEFPTSASFCGQITLPGQEYLVVVARDTRQVQEKLRMLRRDQRYLRALLENLPDNIYFKDLQSRFLRVNHGFSAKFGATDPEVIIGKSDFDYFTDEHARAAYDAEQEIIRTGKPVLNLEEKETWPDGRITWGSTTKLPFYNEYGQIIGTFGVTRDITAKKHTEAALAESQRRLLEASRLAGMAEVASGVLHNVGNAFNSVNTSASLMSDQLRASRLPNLQKVADLIEAHLNDLAAFLSSDARGRQLPAYVAQLARELMRERELLEAELETLRTGVDHIKAVIAMQQSYAHASSIAEVLALQELVEEALVMSASSLERNHIHVLRSFEPGLKVNAPRHRVLEVLVNLVSNAEHAVLSTGRNDPRIEIELKRVDDSRVELRVRDNGTGISAENLQRIFSFGFTTKKTGHGFGLHNSALAAREMGGVLIARSDGPGHGAEFVLRLPLAVG